MQDKDYKQKRVLRTMAIHALAHMTKYKGNNNVKALDKQMFQCDL